MNSNPNYTNFVYIHAVKNVTITMDEKTAAWLRTYAARAGMSVSRFVGAVLHDRMREVRDYNEAFRAFLAQRPFVFDFNGGPPPTREELHERGDLR